MPTDLRPRNEKCQQHGLWEVYWDNGNLWFKGNFINGKADGSFEFYWSNGTLWNKGNYKNGKRIGYWIFYNSGTLKEKRFYAD